MSFCSYEEAWGAPFNQNQEKNDHVTKNDEIAHNTIKKIFYKSRFQTKTMLWKK